MRESIDNRPEAELSPTAGFSMVSSAPPRVEDEEHDTEDTQVMALPAARVRSTARARRLEPQVTQVISLPPADATPGWVAPPSSRPPAAQAASVPPSAPQFGLRPLPSASPSAFALDEAQIARASSSRPPPSVAPRTIALGPNAALAASDQAARAEERARLGSEEDRPAGRCPENRSVEVLWLDADRATALCDRFQLNPPQSMSKPERDREAVSLLLGSHDALSPEALRLEIAEAFSRDGAFELPFVIVEGELELTLDEGELLRAQVASARPFSSTGGKLKERITAIENLLATPDLEGANASAFARVMTDRLRQEFVQANRSLPPSYLDDAATRLVLERRAYQRRMVFGETWLRALLRMDGDKAPIPTYLPDSLSPKLPMFQRIRVAMVVEVHAAQDQYEAHPHSLRALALGRVLKRPDGG